MARMSAHETIPAQAFSTWLFMLSINSKPLAELLLGLAYFSLVKVVELSNRMDPSQPCKNKYTHEESPQIKNRH